MDSEHSICETSFRTHLVLFVSQILIAVIFRVQGFIMGCLEKTYLGEINGEGNEGSEMRKLREV